MKKLNFPKTVICKTYFSHHPTNSRDTSRHQQAALQNQPTGDSPWDSSQQEKNSPNNSNLSV